MDLSGSWSVMITTALVFAVFIYFTRASPRIHDLRHTFAVRTIMDWYRRGLDPDREMLKLSTYLGHSEPVATYWYIQAVPELLQLACERAGRNLGERGAP